jgi:hypothetical protein
LNFGIVNSVTKVNSPEEAIGTVISGGSINENVVAAERAVDGILRALDKAIEYAETAALQYGDKMANDYLVILRQRKRQIELIKQQREQ